MIYGYRIDTAKRTHHCALLIRIEAKDYVLDQDRIWHADQYPFHYGRRVYFVRRPRKAVPTPAPPFEPQLQPDIIEKLMQRIDELEKRPTMKYCGVWDAGLVYLQNDAVTYRGGMWFCHGTTNEKPGTTSNWQLCVKSGVRDRTKTAEVNNDLGS